MASRGEDESDAPATARQGGGRGGGGDTLLGLLVFGVGAALGAAAHAIFSDSAPARDKAADDDGGAVQAAGVGAHDGADEPDAPDCSNLDVAMHFVRSLGVRVGAYFDFSSAGGTLCFCRKCSRARGDEPVYARGEPPRTYVMPVGWSRIGMKLTPHAVAHNIMRTYHVAYHGTAPDAVAPILRTGQLAKPGDVVHGGRRLGIRDGHIKKTFKRKKAGSDEAEEFTPNRIFLSPVPAYSSHAAYASTQRWTHPTTGVTYNVQVMFQVRVRPGSYTEGPETVAARGPIDTTKSYGNDVIEWYTEELGAVVLTGLLVKATRV